MLNYTHMNKIACHACDLLLGLPAIKTGQRAYCPRCNHLLCSKPRNGIQRALAFAISGITFVILANIFPFLAFQRSGREQVITLLQSAFELYLEGSEILSAFVLVFIIIGPILVLCCLVWVLAPLLLKNKLAPGAYMLSRFIFQASPWNMVEIFLVGVLVSLVKIASHATVVLGISFWAYVGFTVSFILTMANLDKHHFWNALDQANK